MFRGAGSGPESAAGLFLRLTKMFTYWKRLGSGYTDPQTG